MFMRQLVHHRQTLRGSEDCNTGHANCCNSSHSVPARPGGVHRVCGDAQGEGGWQGGGLQPARQLLQDWLVRALAKYNLHRHGEQENPSAVQVGN